MKPLPSSSLYWNCVLCDHRYAVTGTGGHKAAMRAQIAADGGQVHEVARRRRVLCGACVARVRAGVGQGQLTLFGGTEP